MPWESLQGVKLPVTSFCLWKGAKRLTLTGTFKSLDKKERKKGGHMQRRQTEREITDN